MISNMSLSNSDCQSVLIIMKKIVNLSWLIILIFELFFCNSSHHKYA